MLTTHRKSWTKSLYVMAVGTVFLWGGASAYAAEDLDAPWSVDDRFPALSTAARSSSKEAERDVPEEMGRACAYIWLKIYQNDFSVVMTSHCPLYPSCSNYSIQAIRQYGALTGIMMTADRLIHESTEMREAPVIQVGERSLGFDPVENNRNR